MQKTVLTIACTVVALVVVFLVYDAITNPPSDCDAVFQQTTMRLTAKVEALKSPVEVSLGRQAATEMTEKVQLAAVMLKACCVQKLSPNEYLACQSGLHDYEREIEKFEERMRAHEAATKSSVEDVRRIVNDFQTATEKHIRSVQEVLRQDTPGGAASGAAASETPRESQVNAPLSVEHETVVRHERQIGGLAAQAPKSLVLGKNAQVTRSDSDVPGRRNQRAGNGKTRAIIVGFEPPKGSRDTNKSIPAQSTEVLYTADEPNGITIVAGCFERADEMQLMIAAGDHTTPISHEWEGGQQGACIYISRRVGPRESVLCRNGLETPLRCEVFFRVN